jgi:predicted nuclease of predicted toxin-antitoxin system
MSVALFMDVHVPGAITRGLRRRDVDVLTAQEDGTDQLKDHELLDRAAVLNRVLFSMDKHLRREAALRQRSGEFFAGVVAADELNITVGQCIEDLELVAKVYDPEDMANKLEYLPL